MKKIAIFVEGQTEAIFTEKLIYALASYNDVEVVNMKTPKFLSLKTVKTPKNNTELFFLICNCEGDDAVKIRIKKNEKKLSENDYISIIGLRDLYPVSRDNLQPIIDNLYVGLENVIPVQIIVAVMEIEAWFLQESNHYSKIDTKLTCDLITEKTGFNPISGDASLIDEPAIFLNEIYELVEKNYSKKYAQVHSITSNLDYDSICLELNTKLPQLGEYIDAIEKHI